MISAKKNSLKKSGNGKKNTEILFWISLKNSALPWIGRGHALPWIPNTRVRLRRHLFITTKKDGYIKRSGSSIGVQDAKHRSLILNLNIKKRRENFILL